MSAQFSECGTYRYRLDRGDPLPSPTALFVMLNPSRAGQMVNGKEIDDQTTRRIVYFAERAGFQHQTIVNLYAFIATNPMELLGNVRAVGPANDSWILGAALGASLIVVAWGDLHRHHVDRAIHVRALLDDAVKTTRAPIMCLGRTKSGRPRHPSRLGNAVALEPYP